MTKVRVPGSCGELVQGTINGQNFLITCPINIFAEVTVTTAAGKSRLAGGEKTRQAVASTLAYLAQSEQALQVISRSKLPQGKGMASSSADISAACVATAVCLERVLTADEIANIALAIEPTDGVFYPGIVMFDHVHGRMRRSLGNPPAMLIAIFDTGGEVDTLHFNQRDDLVLLNAQKEPVVRQAVDLVIQGLATGNCNLIGQGATLSAVANQKILYKPDLPKIIQLSGQFGAVGVSVAHSGTVLGVLFPATCGANVAPCVQAIKAECPTVSYFDCAQLTAGGWLIVDGDINA
jgi:L-threonine kinase